MYLGTPCYSLSALTRGGVLLDEYLNKTTVSPLETSQGKPKPPNPDSDMVPT